MSALVPKILTELRTTFPGIVEEWERQRADNPDWGFPPFDTSETLSWWLHSELPLTEEFGRHDLTGAEQRLAAFCLEAVQRLEEGK
jgi:hypothetical protein